jgi:hypothetical protein
MKPLKNLALLVTLLPMLLTMAGCVKTATVNYEMTIEVDDNGKIYSGRGVWSQTYEGSMPRGRGDAIAVDIGKKGTLFVLVTTRENGPDEVFYGNDLFGNGDRARAIRGQGSMGLNRYEQLTDIASRVGQTGLVDCYNLGELVSCPRMVAFKDMSNPQSVVDVDPINLSAAFGSGVRLRPMRVTVTKERVTKANHCERLPWLNRFNDMQLDGRGYSVTRGIIGQLSAGSFSFEGCK